MKKITLNTIKSENMKIVFDIISNSGTITRSEIAKKSNLSLMTVSNIVDDLINFDAIRSDDKEQTSMVGRKAELLSVNRESKKFIVIDLTTLNFTFVVLNLDLSLHYSSGKWRYRSNDSYQNNLISFLKTTLKYINTQYDSKEIIGLGVSVPGPYDVNQDIVINKRIPALMEIRLKETICSIFSDNCDQNWDIFIDEDVKFATLANIMIVPDYKSKTVYYTYIGEGVGGAISVNGNILRGACSFAGDIGQVLANEDTNFEKLISIEAFANEIREMNNTIEANGFAESIIDFQVNHPDKFKEQLMKYTKIIAFALYNAIWFIDPHAIIIECKYAELDKEVFLEQLKALLSRMLLPVRNTIPDLFLSNQSVEAAYIGAGICLRDRWLSRIS